MLGLGSSNVVVLRKPDGREAMDIEHLKSTCRRMQGSRLS